MTNLINRVFHREEHSIWKGAVAGLVGGLAATVVMTQFQNLAGKLTQPGKESSDGEKDAGGQGQRQAQPKESEPATEKAAEALSETVFHHPLTRKEDKKFAGSVMHYAFGTVMGGVYGALAEYTPKAVTGVGLPFGAVLWLGADEIAVPALGLAKGPTKTPVTTHLNALASHVVYGVTTDLVRRAVRTAI